MRRAPAFLFAALAMGTSLATAQAQPAPAYPDEVLIEGPPVDRPPPPDDRPADHPPGPRRPLCMPLPASGVTRPCPIPPPPQPGMPPLEEGSPCRCGQVGGTVRNGPPHP